MLVYKLAEIYDDAQVNNRIKTSPWSFSKFILVLGAELARTFPHRPKSALCEI